MNIWNISEYVRIFGIFGTVRRYFGTVRRYFGRIYPNYSNIFETFGNSSELYELPKYLRNASNISEIFGGNATEVSSNLFYQIELTSVLFRPIISEYNFECSNIFGCMSKIPCSNIPIYLRIFENIRRYSTEDISAEHSEQCDRGVKLYRFA